MSGVGVLLMREVLLVSGVHGQEGRWWCAACPDRRLSLQQAAHHHLFTKPLTHVIRV